MSIKFTILGCGSSLGVPRIDGSFGKCNPKNKKNYRTRCSALISSSQRNILIDTSPDIKLQLLKNKIKSTKPSKKLTKTAKTQKIMIMIINLKFQLMKTQSHKQ